MKPVVYIDDEELLCRVFKRVLASCGSPVVTFTEPEAAIAYIHEHPPAVVICDYRMPSLTGLQVLERLAPGIPFYLVSGNLGVASLRSHPGVTGALTKPFRPEALLDIVQLHVGR